MGEVDDTFRIAEILLADKQELVQKAVGGLLGEAGKRTNKSYLASSTGMRGRWPASR
jgi:3-methyladenine DNA glycosylase AlkD